MPELLTTRPDPEEIASGLVLGLLDGPDADALRAAVPPTLTPLAALERAVLPALSQPPCLVSFSGGTDSSLVLAVAVRAARRHGLPAPVPVTWRFTGAPQADESPWQDRILQALGVPDREVLHAGDDLDLIGPVARRLLLRHGVLHPTNLHLHLPIIERAAGGALLTGAGGDQVLLGWRPPPHLPTPAGLYRRLRRGTPASGGRFGPPLSWLRPEHAQRLLAAYRAERRAEPRRLDRRTAWHARRRDTLLTCAALQTVAADHAVRVVNPLLDPAFLGALALRAGNRYRATRAELLALIAEGRFPPVVTAPRRKATFYNVFFRCVTRGFVATQVDAGTGPDLVAVGLDGLVDPGLLAAAWSRWPVPPATAGLVQQLWLAGRRPAVDRTIRTTKVVG